MPTSIFSFWINYLYKTRGTAGDLPEPNGVFMHFLYTLFFCCWIIVSCKCFAYLLCIQVQYIILSCTCVRCVCAYEIPWTFCHGWCYGLSTSQTSILRGHNGNMNPDSMVIKSLEWTLRKQMCFLQMFTSITHKNWADSKSSQGSLPITTSRMWHFIA